MPDFDIDQASEIAQSISTLLHECDDLVLRSPDAWCEEIGHDLADIRALCEGPLAHDEPGAEDDLAAELVRMAARAIRAAASCGPVEWGIDPEDSAQELAFALAGTFLAEAEGERGWGEWLGALASAHGMIAESLAAFDDVALHDDDRTEAGRSVCLNFLLVGGGAVAALLGSGSRQRMA